MQDLTPNYMLEYLQSQCKPDMVRVLVLMSQPLLELQCTLHCLKIKGENSRNIDICMIHILELQNYTICGLKMRLRSINFKIMGCEIGLRHFRNNTQLRTHMVVLCKNNQVDHGKYPSSISNFPFNPHSIHWMTLLLAASHAGRRKHESKAKAIQALDKLESIK